MEISIRNKESKLLKSGAMVAYTGEHTGRSPNAKRIVKDSYTADKIDWENNEAISEEEFQRQLDRFLWFRDEAKRIYKKDIYLQEVYAVRDTEHSLAADIYTEYAKHSMFVRNMFVPDRDIDTELKYTLYQFPSLSEEPMVLVSITKKIILISGTLYSGEIKKSIFTVLNYHFPEKNYLPMHCSVNVDKDGENPAIFFGLSGTGKTTLSSEEGRILIGDDEHGWTDDGLTNFENGCYAKTINLSKELEPQIWSACQKPGAILENVVIKDGIPDFDDPKHTQNGRASYPASFIDGADEKGYVKKHPKNIIMLTCDAFGVLPPVMKLDKEEAVKQFLLGYTAKVAGTENGVTEPVATFSHCFGAPFMPLPGKRYAEILKEKIEKHDVQCWLVNTGWTGGGYGVGKRMSISVTRNIINKIHDGSLAEAKTFKHKYTGFSIPDVKEDVIPSNILKPELGWKDKSEYESSVSDLIFMLNEEAKKY